jgi:hypothetical protein
MILKYKNEETTYYVEFKKISKNIVEIKGDFPIKDVGFTLSRKDKNDNWDYLSCTTVYKKIEGGAQFSNDGSVWVEPTVKIPTEEELALMEENQRIANINAQINNLKEQLASTDYKIIKCAECSMVGEEMPYDVNELHTERQAIRDGINLLEYTL